MDLNNVVVIQYECPINEIKCASPLPVTDSQILPIKKAFFLIIYAKLIYGIK